MIVKTYFKRGEKQYIQFKSDKNVYFVAPTNFTDADSQTAKYESAIIPAEYENTFSIIETDEKIQSFMIEPEFDILI